MKHTLAVCVLLTAAPVGAIACSCVPAGTVQQEMASSSRVFHGRVTAVRSTTPQVDTSLFSAVIEWVNQLFGAAPPAKDRDFPYRQVSFAVDQTFKGKPVRIVHLMTGIGGGDCGYAFQTGQAYVVYAHGGDDALEAGICSLTGPVSDPRSGLAILRDGS